MPPKQTSESTAQSHGAPIERMRLSLKGYEVLRMHNLASTCRDPQQQCWQNRRWKSYPKCYEYCFHPKYNNNNNYY